MVIRMTKEIRHFSKNKNLHLILSIIMTILSAFIQVYVIQVFMNPCNLPVFRGLHHECLEAILRKS